jgi:hypothetical protein
MTGLTVISPENLCHLTQPPVISTEAERSPAREVRDDHGGDLGAGRLSHVALRAFYVSLLSILVPRAAFGSQ